LGLRRGAGFGGAGFTFGAGLAVCIAPRRDGGSGVTGAVSSPGPSGRTELCGCSSFPLGGIT